MDLGVLLESPQGSQSSSRVGACTCAFLPSCGSSVALPSRGSRDLWLSIEAFPGGFPTRLSLEAFPQGCPTCHRGESILGLKAEAMRGKQVSLEQTETSGGLWEWWHDPGVPLAFLWRAPPLEIRRERGEFFPHDTGKGSLLSS